MTLKKPEKVRVYSFVNSETLKQLRDIAEERQSNVSQIVRDAIRFYLNHKENNEY